METNRQPFQDTIDTAIFYGGGARREIVDEIKEALADEVQLLTLTGTDGSGKTMICRMVEQELQAHAEILFFEQGVESFDEVVNRIAAHVELEETDQGDRNTLLEKAVESLNQQDRRLILILDGAEKIFLATLERIRRMLDQVNGSRLAIQLLISGRPLFSLNFKQLAIINFNAVKEQHFSLDPLDGRATHLYLNHCLDQSDTEEQKRFSLSQAEEIADIARGNFKLINQLARKLLDLKRLAGEKGEAVQDYDDGADLPDDSSRLATGLANVDLDFLKVPKIGFRWYAAGAGLVILVLLIALLRGGGEEDTVEKLPGAEDVPDLTLEKVEPDPIDIPDTLRSVEPLQPPLPGVTPEEPPSEVAGSSPPLPASESIEETLQPVAQEPEQTPEPLVQEPEQTPEPLVQEPEQTPEPLVQESEPGEDSAFAGQAPAVGSAQEPESGVVQTDSQEVEDPPSVEESKEVGGTDVPPAVVQEESVVLESGPAEESVPEAPKRKALEESPEIQEESTAASIPAEQSEEVDVEPPDETAAPPKLTVLPKKIPTTEPAPTKVVTLKEESKIRPDLPASSVPAAETAPPPRREEEGTDEAVRPPTVTEAEDEPFTPESRPEQVASIDRADEAAADSSAIRPRSEVTAKDSSLYYAQRLAAGSRWLVGGSREKYTVQLMVLSSEDAQQNVRYMLSEESYRPIMDQLYILRKIAQPQTVMLYWGEFDTPAQAREARNRLPSFLSRLEPFEIPVKDAVAKARAGQ